MPRAPCGTETVLRTARDGERAGAVSSLGDPNGDVPTERRKTDDLEDILHSRDIGGAVDADLLPRSDQCAAGKIEIGAGVRARHRLEAVEDEGEVRHRATRDRGYDREL